SLAWALDVDLARTRLVTMASLVAMYLAAVSFRISEKELRFIVALTVIGGVLAAAMGSLSGFTVNPEARNKVSLGGRDANPNALGHSLLLPIAMAVALLTTARRRVIRLAMIVGICVLAAAIFLTVSRSSIAAVILMMCVFLYRLRVRWQIILVIAAVAILVPFMPNLFF